MTWTDKPPMEPGWYWFKGVWVSPRGVKYPYMVIRHYGKDEVDTNTNSTYRWAGPIPEPEE